MFTAQTCARPKPVERPENRVGEIFGVGATCTGENPFQSLEPHRETFTVSTTTASGVVYWLSKDPIGISGGLNLYVFCGNNPVNFVDPMGLYQTIFGDDDGYSGTKGYWNVGGGGLHGSEGQGYFSDGKGNQISPETVYAQMKADGYKDGTPIKLYVCYAALPGGDAKKLAQLAKASVLANTDLVKILHSSFLGIKFNYWEYGVGEWKNIPSCGGSK